MELIIRNMRPGETQASRKLAGRAFGFPERLLIPQPKEALIAEIDDEMVGGMYYYSKIVSGKKLGYASFFFVGPAHKGKGIGGKLCKATTDLLWEQGCDLILTYVRDDNVPSWGAFENCGYVRTTFPEVAKTIGLAGAVRECVFSMFGIALGHDLYMALPTEIATKRAEKKDGLGQIALFLLLPFLFLAHGFLTADRNALPPAILGLLAIFLGLVVFAWLGTRVSARRKWRFRLNNGGFAWGPITLLSSFVPMFGIFVPMNGSWYPERYENTKAFWRDLAITSLFTWLPLLAAMAAVRLLPEPHQILREASGIVGMFLVLRCFPFSALGPYGGERVWRWNKAVWAVLAAAGLFLVYVLPRIL
ncbi:MAG: GNAT family N-acetyltransferase [Oscillospiraceae bacterium]|nr:GNAT family N-acetyltransferase [Oscillospiraceae bacterium]